MKPLLLSVAVLALSAPIASAVSAPPPRDAENPADCSYPADFGFDDGGGAFDLAGLSGQYCSSWLIVADAGDRAATATFTAEADRRLQFGGSLLADVAPGDEVGLVLMGAQTPLTDFDDDGRGFFDVVVRRGDTFGFYYAVAGGTPGGTLAVDYFAEPPGGVPAPVPLPATLPLALLGGAALLAARRRSRYATACG